MDELIKELKLWAATHKLSSDSREELEKMITRVETQSNEDLINLVLHIYSDWKDIDKLYPDAETLVNDFKDKKK